MPLPLLIGIGAAIAGAAGLGAGINGAVKMKEANDTMESAQRRHKRNINRFEEKQKAATCAMDNLGKLELDTVSSFKRFQDVIEKIQNRPEFKSYSKNGVKIPKYDKKEIERASVGAAVLAGGLSGAAVGTAGGFAASGIATAAVMALGTASTGTAISTLSGAAATNAALAALGGGSIAAGGGGIALGTAILGGATLGVGLLVGGIIFNFTGSSLSDRADEAWSQMIKAEKKIDSVCPYLDELKNYAEKYLKAFKQVNDLYNSHMEMLLSICESHVDIYRTIDWNNFLTRDKLITENTSLIVGMLYKMCKLNIVEKASGENEMNTINKININNSIQEAEKFLQDERFTA